MAESSPQRGFHTARAHLSKSDDLILYHVHVVIPTALRSNVIKQLHEGHQGLTKCHEQARLSIRADITSIVKSCDFCAEHKPIQRQETLVVTLLPGGPWQKIVVDLCELNGKNYFVMMNYIFSRHRNSSSNNYGKQTGDQ